MVTGKNLTTTILCKNADVFFALLRAGLWREADANLNLNAIDNLFEGVEWEKIYQLALEQSVLGLVLAGLEQYKNLDVNLDVNQKLILQWIGDVQLIEQRNKEMNAFIASLIGDLRKANIYTLIVKGQGVAQCYERPLWRASGDIDFYLNEGDFQKAKTFFRPLVDNFDPDDDYTRHINMHYGSWVVEIHANQYCSISPRINRVLNEVHNDIFYNGRVRSWVNNGTQIFLPSADNDALIIFTHFFNHFYRGGVGLRQICDWCRLLWKYRGTLDLELLENRIRKAGLLDEWRAFGAFAVEYLGMPIAAMPFLKNTQIASLNKKADKICEFILEVGNFGHNRDTSYYGKHPFLVRKAISASRRLEDWLRHASIFPLDSIRFLFGMTITSFNAVLHGE